MSEDLMLKCLIAFILGYLASRMMGNGFSVGCQSTDNSKLSTGCQKELTTMIVGNVPKLDSNTDYNKKIGSLTTLAHTNTMSIKQLNQTVAQLNHTVTKNYLDLKNELGDK